MLNDVTSAGQDKMSSIFRYLSYMYIFVLAMKQERSVTSKIDREVAAKTNIFA